MAFNAIAIDDFPLFDTFGCMIELFKAISSRFTAASASMLRRALPETAKSAVCVLVFTLGFASCAMPEHKTATLGEPRLTRTILLPGVTGTRTNVGVPGRIDHMAFDPETKRLFVAALENGSMEVVDIATGKRIRSIGGLQQPQGVAIVPGSSRAALACGGDGLVHVYDTHSLEEVKTVEVGPDADNVRYDAKENTVYVSYGTTNGGAIAVLDALTWAKLREIPFPSRPESFQLDPSGNRLFANLPRGVRAVADGSVAAANRNDARIESQIQLKDRARNFPMAFDVAHRRLFIATRRPARLIAIDTSRFETIAEAACTDDSDDLFYDADTGRVMVVGGGFRPDLQEPGMASPHALPGGMGAIDVFAVGGNGELTRIASTPSASHARTGLYVPSLRALYVAVPMHEGRDPEIREYRFGQ